LIITRVKATRFVLDVGNAGFEREGKADHPGLLEAALCGTFDDADFGFRNDFLELDLG
jgi:hypothetical protein